MLNVIIVLWIAAGLSMAWLVLGRSIKAAEQVTLGDLGMILTCIVLSPLLWVGVTVSWIIDEGPDVIIWKFRK